jgi:pimeloyl-ACP methyl ester carboxylesterase
MTEFLERPDGRIAYDDSGGDGTLIVAAPGMGDLRGSYRHLAPLLVDVGYRFVSMDLRGVGESTVEWPDYSDAAIGTDMTALIDHLGGGPAVLVGNSLTAASAVIAATEAPASVRSLVLMGPFARAVPAPAWQGLLFKAMLSPPWGRGAWVSYYRKQMYPSSPPADHAGYVAALKANLGEPGRYRAFRSLAFNSHAESESRLSDVNVPVLIIMGTADPDFPDPEAEAHGLGESLQGSVVLVDGVGHYPQAEAPDQTAKAIREFLR